MRLDSVIQNLALGELSQTPLVKTGDLNINPVYLPKLIQAINRSLEYFYSSFMLKQNQVLIKLLGGVSHYKLDSAHAQSNTESTEVKYILDRPHAPFADDVIQILEVGDTFGNLYPLDDVGNPATLLLPMQNVLHVPNELPVDVLSIVYQAGHKKFPLDTPEDAAYEVELPDSMMSAFMAYVACIVLQSMGGANVEMSNAFYAKHMSLMELLSKQGIGDKLYQQTNHRPYLNGWI